MNDHSKQRLVTINKTTTLFIIGRIGYSSEEFKYGKKVMFL
jgi:hypothetical protein